MTASLQSLFADIETVADGLGELLPDVVFVGGSTVPFYLQNPEREQVRVTDDIDIVLQISNYISYAKVEQNLLEKGFEPDLKSKVAIRKRYKGIVVDVMPSDTSVWGFSNQWYEEGIRTSQKRTLSSGHEIHIFTLPYFLGSKLVAHSDRAPSMNSSDDLEDIFLILNANQDIGKDLGKFSDALRVYLSEKAAEFLKMPELDFRELCDGYRVSNDRIREAFRYFAGENVEESKV